MILHLSVDEWLMSAVVYWCVSKFVKQEKIQNPSRCCHPLREVPWSMVRLP